MTITIGPSLTLTSKLEAVNIILRSAGETQVSSLAVTGLAFLDNAQADLLEASRLIQSVGWKFNTEDAFPLTRDTTGYIALPGNTIKCDVDDSFNGSTNAIQRGTNLYDATAHSYIFKQDLTASMVFLLTWDELPEPARHYITIKAARKFQARDFGSDSQDRFTANDELQAMLALSQHEADTGDYNMLSDSRSVASILYEKQDFTPWY